jgi:hypothetical protein
MTALPTLFTSVVAPVKPIIYNYPRLGKACQIVEQLLTDDQFLIKMFRPVAVVVAMPYGIPAELTDGLFVSRLKAALYQPPLPANQARKGAKTQQKKS